MAKQIKGNVGRRQPPEPSESHADIDEWFGNHMPGVVPIIKSLDQAIRDAVPGLQYAVKWKRAFYGLPNLGWIVELAPYAVSVNVVFYGGADFDPAPSLGSTDRSRYVKVTSVDEADSPQLVDWLRQAGRTTGWV